ncbi:hypothetical protein FOA52_012204 [Chlamydomonas sp. UWO 241]|nr:hypothetical protein FOA52_012204 [Chlamydomonas sp. UWO 241]
MPTRHPTAMELNKITIAEMKATPWMRFPDDMLEEEESAEMEGNNKHLIVRQPRGLVITGDLIDHGSDAQKCKSELDDWENLYGLHGARYLPWPVYEGFGNHDGGNLTVASGECNDVRVNMGRRNQRRLLSGRLASLSDNRLHYSWDWGPLHLVQLNLYPGDGKEASEWPPSANGTREPGSFQYPEFSLEFLIKDLRENVGRSGRPVILFMHYGFDSYWSALWWTDHERTLLADALAAYNVAAIFVGHTHVAQTYSWEGYDVFNSPTAARGMLLPHGTTLLPPQFFVVQLELGKKHYSGGRGTLRVALREGAGWHATMRSVKVVELGVEDGSGGGGGGGGGDGSSSSGSSSRDGDANAAAAAEAVAEGEAVATIATRAKHAVGAAFGTEPGGVLEAWRVAQEHGGHVHEHVPAQQVVAAEKEAAQHGPGAADSRSAQRQGVGWDAARAASEADPLFVDERERFAGGRA